MEIETNMKTEAQNVPERDCFIDALKGIGSIFVIITHFSWTNKERLMYLFPFWIGMAVPIFMILSGYVYSLSYEKRHINRMRDAYMLKNISKKILRYTIPFAIAFLIEIVYLSAVGSYSGQAVPDVVFHLGLDFLKGGYGPGGYYYPIMMQFIFVFPVIYFLIKKYRAKGLLLCGFLNLVFELLQRACSMDKACYKLLLFRYLLVVAVGCYMACEKSVCKKIWLALSFLVGLTFLIAYCYLGYSPRILIYWTKTSFLACLYIIPIMIVLLARVHSFHMKLLELCGKASYHIYLTQMVWYAYGTGVMEKLVHSRGMNLCINIVVCIWVGIAFYYVETPITKRLIHKVNRHLIQTK